MDSTEPEISSLSTRGYFAFRNELSGIVENGTWIAGALFDQKPFKSIEEYHEKLCEFIDQLPTRAQVGIIRCCPPLLSASIDSLSKFSRK